MKGILSKLFIFAVGAGIGSAVTYKVVSTKYDKLIQEEIDSVKEQFGMLYSGAPEKVEDEEKNDAIPATEKALDMKEYAAIMKNSGYVNYSDKKEDTEVNDVEKPYVISPDDFGEIYDYETNYLTYYSDGVLTDDQDGIVDDVEGIVGLESLKHFGDYEEDLVHVRNDRLKCDYEISLDNMPYPGTDR